MDWLNLEEVKEYYKNYRETHKEEKRMYDKKYYEANKEKKDATNREYRNKYIVTKFYKYVSVCFCEKCGKKGYKKYKRNYNKKTGNYHKIMTYVHHLHKEDGKTVYDGTCYIGMGEL